MSSDALQDESICGSAEPFVRRSALVATSELLRAVPPPALAGAMLRAERAEGDAALAARLQALQAMLRATRESSEADGVTRALAGGCLALQSELADGAMAAIEAGAAAGDGVDLSRDGARGGREILLPPW